MRAIHRFHSTAAVALGILTASASASADTATERTGAPYIVVTSSDVQTDSLPLKESRADVNIAGVMAHVTVTQIYENRGQVPLEAKYVFPGSTRAAVFGMQMTVGDRITRAKIAKKEAARKLYESAREQGKTASLLEQHRPNVFQMNVANILPGDIVTVELSYTELIVPTDGVYEFVYPAVVGPRYAGEQTSGETWHENDYGSAGAGAPYGFAVNVNIATGVPLHGLASPSHTVKPAFVGHNRARLGLSSHRDGDRDFVLRYRLRGDAVETGLLRFEDKDEKFFLLMVQPPERVVRDDLPAREYVFIVDVSGSMSGFPLDTSKQLIANLLRGLRAQDSFNILFFSGGSYQLSPRSISASQKNIARAIRVLEQRRGGGGTNLVAALEKALKMPAGDGTARTFVAVTDGFISADDRAFATVHDNLGEANFFAFGIGRSVNRNLIEGLARAGMGEPFVVLDGNQAPRQAEAFRKLIGSPVLTDVKATFRDFDAYDVVPRAIPDLFADRPLVIFGKYSGKGTGAIEVSGISGRGRFGKRIQVDSAPAAPANAGLRYLWARQRIAELADRIVVTRNPEYITAVTNLGLKYSLLTEYTSFVAVDERVRNTQGKAVPVDQKLPLPAGMSNPSGSAIASPNNTLASNSSGDEVIIVTGSAISADRPDVYPVNAASKAELSYGGATVSEMLTTLPGMSHGSTFQALDERSSTISSSIANKIALSQRFRIARRDDQSIISTPLQLRLGFANTLEARVGSSLYTRAVGETLKPDLNLGVKLRLPSPTRLMRLALLADYRATFDDLDEEQDRTRAVLLADAWLFDAIALRANLGAGYLDLRDVDERVLGLVYGAEVVLPGVSSYSFALYPHVGVAGIARQNPTSALEVGLASHIGKSWALGLLLQFGLTDNSDDFASGLFLRYAPSR